MSGKQTLTEDKSPRSPELSEGQFPI